MNQMSDFNMGAFSSTLIFIKYPSILDNKIKMRNNSVKRGIIATAKGRNSTPRGEQQQAQGTE